jgi:hypothetical protein
VGISVKRNDAAGGIILKKRSKLMGDRSPKSNQKKSNQKQAKTNSSDQKKAALIASKKAPVKK